SVRVYALVPRLRMRACEATAESERFGMINGKRVVVVLPAYNAARTLARTYAEVPEGIVDEFILVDDASQDDTVRVADSLGIECHVHAVNRGYGGNQKTCYTEALR